MRFGQELYPQETIIAAAILADACSPHEMTESRVVVGRIADKMPHASPATRHRVAMKLVQRLAAASPPAFSVCASVYEAGNSLHDGNGSANSAAADTLAASASALAYSPVSTPANAPAASHNRLHTDMGSFARLLAFLPDTQARRELVFYAAARADGLIEAIAREILYPYFIEGRIPPSYGEDEFIMANAGLLLAPEPILTAGFVADFARRVWQFESERTVCLALRILRQAGILLAAPLLGERGRVAAYTLAPHGLSLAALLWGLHREFGDAGAAPAWDQVGRAQFAQLYVVPPAVIISRLWEAERAGLVGFWSAGGTKRVALKVREAEALSRLLLSGPLAK